MKVKHLLVALSVAFVSACSNDSLNEIVDQSQVKSRSVENMLSFDNEALFQQTVYLLSNMDEDEQKAWISSHLGIITSLKDVYDEAMRDAAALDESREAYMVFKEKYGTVLYFSSYKDDYGAYLPVSDKIVATLLNINGEVQIGDKVYNLKNIENYTQLQEAGYAMYDGESDRNYVESRSVETAPIVGVAKNGQAIGEEYISGWHQENGKKIKLNCGRQVSSIDNARRVITPRLHIEISFRKKTWLGWTNYSSETTTTGTFSGGYVGTINFHKKADSSHDWYQDFSASILGTTGLNSGKILYYSAPIIANLSVEYRGMPTIQKYSFILGEVKFAGI